MESKELKTLRTGSNETLEVMLEEMSGEQLEQAKKIIEEKLDPKVIKQKSTGRGPTLSYISGATVIDMLNKAFNYRWSFEVLETRVTEELDLYNGGTKKGRMVEVKGRLTVPGIGVKEQWGSQVMRGGMTVQEHAKKGAATDAMKKCASLVGIGRELYMDENEFMAATADKELPETSASKSAGNPQKAQQQYKNKPTTKKEKKEPANDWSKVANEVNRMKELKNTLGIEDNDDLVPFLTEWSGGSITAFLDDNGKPVITPQNIKSFNDFLDKQVS